MRSVNQFSAFVGRCCFAGWNRANLSLVYFEYFADLKVAHSPDFGQGGSGSCLCWFVVVGHRVQGNERLVDFESCFEAVGSDVAGLEGSGCFGVSPHSVA